MQSVPITTKVASSNLVHGEVYSKQNYVIKFVSDRSVVFSRYSGSYINKTDRHDIAEILLKVSLNTINQILTTNFRAYPEMTLYLLICISKMAATQLSAFFIWSIYIEDNFYNCMHVNCQNWKWDFELSQIKWDKNEWQPWNIRGSWSVGKTNNILWSTCWN